MDTFTTLSQLLSSDDEEESPFDFDDIRSQLESDDRNNAIDRLITNIDSFLVSNEDKITCLLLLQTYMPEECYGMIRNFETGYQVNQLDSSLDMLQHIIETIEFDPQARLNCALTILNVAKGIDSSLLDLAKQRKELKRTVQKYDKAKPETKRMMKNEYTLAQSRLEETQADKERLKESKNSLLSKSYRYILSLLNEPLPLLVLIDCCKRLYLCDVKEERKFYREKSVEKMTELLNDPERDSKDRYKLLIKMFNENKEYKGLVDKIQIPFFNSELNGVRERILSGSYLLQYAKLTKSAQQKVINTLISIAKNDEYDENTRADAADALQFCCALEHVNNSEGYKTGIDIIRELGKSSEYTIYDNSQNVHDETISANVKRILNEISMDKIPPAVTYEAVNKDILDVLDKSDSTKAKSALDRINMDTTVFDNGMSLQDIMVRVWCRVMRHEHKESIIKNFIYELVDMAETCTSGHEKRLVNILTTMGEATIHISFRDQIIANFKGRMLKRLKEMKDEEYKGLVLSGMISVDGNERVNFARFIMDTYPKVREELYSEFVGENHVEEQEFDEYFTDALRAFQSYESKNV